MRIEKHQFEVGYENEDGEYFVDGMFKLGMAAEVRAKKLAKIFNCDYGMDY